MIKTIKLIGIILIISIPLFIISCVDGFETPSRTPETEQSELKQAIANIEAGGYDVDTTDLGVFYVMHEEGTGPLPQKGDTCYLIYTGYFLSGLIFDSSGYHYPDSVWQFNYKDIALIPGFNDGIALLKKGAKADIIVPSSLAYGPTGQGEIQPYTPLVFSLIMRDMKPVE